MTDSEKPVGEFVPVGTPIDLDNCAREPIHIAGSIQPRGVLAVVREPGFEVVQVSADVAELLGRSVDAVLGRHLSALIGADQAARIERAAASIVGDLRQVNPLECVIEVVGSRGRSTPFLPSTSGTCRTWVCTRRCRSRYCGADGCGG